MTNVIPDDINDIAESKWRLMNESTLDIQGNILNAPVSSPKILGIRNMWIFLQFFLFQLIQNNCHNWTVLLATILLRIFLRFSFQFIYCGFEIPVGSVGGGRKILYIFNVRRLHPG